MGHFHAFHIRSKYFLLNPMACFFISDRVEAEAQRSREKKKPGPGPEEERGRLSTQRSYTNKRSNYCVMAKNELSPPPGRAPAFFSLSTSAPLHLSLSLMKKQAIGFGREY